MSIIFVSSCITFYKRVSTHRVDVADLVVTCCCASFSRTLFVLDYGYWYKEKIGPIIARRQCLNIDNADIIDHLHIRFHPVDDGSEIYTGYMLLAKQVHFCSVTNFKA